VQRSNSICVCLSRRPEKRPPPARKKFDISIVAREENSPHFQTILARAEK
jgi:hypothetical protein